MSRLEELIAKLCPDGVEYKTLGEIAVDVYRGSGITKDQVTPTGTPCIRYGEIYTTYGIWFEECVSFTNESSITNKKYFEYGDILFSITGESVEEIAKSCAYIGHEKCLAGGDIVVLKHNQDPKYLSYALSTTDAQKQKSKGKVKSKVVHSSVPAIGNICIPLPPLEVQQEIVRILDKFTVLEAELEAELEARKKQYEFYRNLLISFSDDMYIDKFDKLIRELCPDGVEYRALGEICEFQRGTSITKNDVTDGAIPVIAGGQKPAYYHNVSNRAGETIVISSSGAYAGFVSFWTIPIFLSDSFSVNPDINHLTPKYVFYFLKNIQEKVHETKKGGGIPHVHGSSIAKFRIPVPPLEVQQEIVRILDRFDTLVNDIAQGLPAEIAARHKQYEYYRDKLLTFREKSA